MPQLTLTNSLTRKKEPFQPLDPDNVTIYVCGPTVYDSPHIGNARAVVVYDLLVRLLQHLYPKVTYVRNITDVDDKINAAAKERGISIQDLTTEVTAGFHADMAALNNLPPTHEPKATEHIPQIIALIEKIIENGHGYASEGHVLFDVSSVGDAIDEYSYGLLSGKKQEDLIAGARVAVESYKRAAEDFVLWKPADADDDPSSVFDSPWGQGRPGWHIECSAMSTTYLGEDFDIHGGGADLKFPHHENEIVQSCCANKHSRYARTWVHNGFLTVEGEKMSKSLGNFITVRELLDKGVSGEVVRYVLLATHYGKPLDFTEQSLNDAKKNLDKFYKKIKNIDTKSNISGEFVSALCEDLNTSKAIAWMHGCDDPAALLAAGQFMGLLEQHPDDWFAAKADVDEAKIEALIAQRNEAKAAKNWAEADRIRDELTAMGITLKDGPDGTSWEVA